MSAPILTPEVDAALSTDPATARRRLARISSRPDFEAAESDSAGEAALVEVSPGHLVLR